MAAPGFLGRRSGERAPREKITKHGLQTALGMLKYLRPYRGWYVLGMIFLGLSTATSLLFPYILGQMVNSATGSQDWWLPHLDSIALLLALVVVAQMVFSFFRVYTFSLVSQNAMADIRRSVYHQLLSLPMVFFDRRRVGELTSRITADVQQLQDVLMTTVAEFFRQIITLVGGITFVLVQTPKLALFMLAVFPPLIIVAVVFGRFIRKQSKKTQDDLAEANVVLEESLHNISIVKSFVNELFELGRYRESMRRVVKNAIKTDTYRGIFISFMMLAIFGSFVAVIWFGGKMVESKEMQIGDLFTFILFMAFIGGSLGGLPEVYSQILKAVGATERLREILGETAEINLDKQQGVQTAIDGVVSFESVRFTYATRPEVEVLKGIDLKVQAGEKIALAGASGAGKSTIAQLLMRFYEPSSGVIMVDGIDSMKFDLSHLRNHIGIVPQEVILFGGTIKENIAYGKLNATEDEIKKAAQKANALEFIEGFPEGLETVVGERGVKLSGGQRQRIAIARAILKDPAILILDEATSSLDAESEKSVQDALDVLMQNRTTLIIAHRLATIRNVDRIYVLDEGKIVESGSHDDLIRNPDGYYTKLVNLQMQGNQTDL
jgi:ABC-type multidrug transport system fused ATPase/permease subunit